MCEESGERSSRRRYTFSLPSLHHHEPPPKGVHMRVRGRRAVAGPLVTKAVFCLCKEQQAREMPSHAIVKGKFLEHQRQVFLGEPLQRHLQQTEGPNSMPSTLSGAAAEMSRPADGGSSPRAGEAVFRRVSSVHWGSGRGEGGGRGTAERVGWNRWVRGGGGGGGYKFF